jgi:hypothetical protein
MSTCDSVWSFQNLLASQYNPALDMSVTSVSAGTGGVTVTGPTTQPVINIPTPVTSVSAGTGSVTVTGPPFQPVVNGPVITAGTNTTVTGTLMAPQVNVASPLTLSAPLALSTTSSTLPTQLGFTLSATNAALIQMTSTIPVVLATIAITSPGVYLFQANPIIQILGGTSVRQIVTYIDMTPTQTPGSTNSAVCYGPTTMTVNDISAIPLTSVFTVTSAGTVTFNLNARGIYTGSANALYVLANGTIFTATRIA